MNKRCALAVILSAALCVLFCAGCSTSGTQTTENESTASASESQTGSESQVIHAVIQWAEGGGTDSVVRPLIELAASGLSGTIETENMIGMAGALAFQNVYSQEADGTYLLMGAENPCLYPILGYSDEDYSDFECVCLIGSEVVGVVVAADSPYQTFTEIVEAALNGEEIVMSSTNVGGMPWTIAAMVEQITGAQFVQQWYAGDAEAEQAVLDGEVDFTFCKLQTGLADYQAGTLRYLNVFSDTEVESLESVPAITEEYPDFADYLPWGPFYGVFVKSGTPEETVTELKEVFLAAWEDESYQTTLEELQITPLGLCGDEAAEYIQAWQEKTVSILSESELTYSFRFNTEE